MRLFNLGTKKISFKTFVSYLLLMLTKQLQKFLEKYLEFTFSRSDYVGVKLSLLEI